MFRQLVADFRMQRVGGGVGSGVLYDGQNLNRRLSDDELAGLPPQTAGRRVVFAVHGFNVNRDEGLASLGKFMQLLDPQMPDALQIAILWPGDSYFGPLSYPFEGTDADDTARNLANLIGAWIDPHAQLYFVGHSKGCRVIMRCIQSLRARRPAPAVAQVCLTAAAMDDTCLADRSRFGFADATSNAGRVAVLSSVNDKVLGLAYPLGDLLQGWLYAGTDEPGSALGLGGPKFPDRSDENARRHVRHEPTPRGAQVGHGDYLCSATGDATKHRQTASFVAAVFNNDPAPHF